MKYLHFIIISMVFLITIPCYAQPEREDVKFESKRMKINNIEIQIQDYRNNGEPIIFLHYGGGNLKMWEKITPQFENQFRPVLIDLRGHGKSEMPEKGYHIDTMAQDVLGVLKQLNINEAHFVGSSLGGEVALSIAALYPDKVKTLVLEGALYSEFGDYGIYDGTELEYKKLIEEKLITRQERPCVYFSSEEELLEDFKKNMEKRGAWNESFYEMKKYSVRKIADKKYVSEMGNEQWVDYLKYYYYYKFEDYYRKLQCPLLLVADEYSINNKRTNEIINDFSKLVKDCEVLKIEGWEHAYGWLQKHQEVSSAILKFIEKN